MATLNYREAISAAMRQEMRRDPDVVTFGEDIGREGGVFKTTKGLFEEFGGSRVRDTPISEQAIAGLAMGAAMAGMRPVAEIMFSDFFAVCWDVVANQIAKTRYMSGGQVRLPLVIRSANGGGVGFGAQHSQSVENWAMAVPGLKVVVPSSVYDAASGLVAAIRDPDPALMFEPKILYSLKGEVPDPIEPSPLGTARVLRRGADALLVALGAMVPESLAAADVLSSEHGIQVSVVDLFSLVPLDVTTVVQSLMALNERSLVFTVEENPRLCGWGAELSSILCQDYFELLLGPVTRISTPHLPLPAAESLEAAVRPSAGRIVATVVDKFYPRVAK
jgi:pyruvate/2-oxoglutarate/acetoin dehydrogenase E1 component